MTRTGPPSPPAVILCGSGKHDRRACRRSKPIAPAGSEATEGREAEREARPEGFRQDTPIFGGVS